MEISFAARHAKPADLRHQAQFEEGNRVFMTIDNRDGFSRPLAAVGGRQSGETASNSLMLTQRLRFGSSLPWPFSRFSTFGLHPD
jgi:hypothetical protein